MPPSDDFDQSLFLMLAGLTNAPEIVVGMAAIRQLTHFDIPKEEAGAFLRFHSFITSPQPAYITEWRADSALETKWYHAHVNGVLGDVRSAVSAAHYHAGRLTELERSVMNVAIDTGVLERMGGSAIGLGGTEKLNFEYQAFILAYRRALDYLAGALACYFKREANSFRKLPKALAGTEKHKVASAISDAHARHTEQLAFVLEEGKRSVRNRIAHYEAVSAGCVNINRNGISLVGGGENLSPSGGSDQLMLAKVLEMRLADLHKCIEDVIDSFIEAAREIEHNKNK